MHTSPDCMIHPTESLFLFLLKQKRWLILLLPVALSQITCGGHSPQDQGWSCILRHLHVERCWVNSVVQHGEELSVCQLGKCCCCQNLTAFWQLCAWVWLQLEFLSHKYNFDFKGKYISNFFFFFLGFLLTHKKLSSFLCLSLSLLNLIRQIDLQFSSLNPYLCGIRTVSSQEADI